MERTRNVLLDVLYSHERLTRVLLSILSRGATFHYRERSCGMSELGSTGYLLHSEYPVYKNILVANRP